MFSDEMFLKSIVSTLCDNNKFPFVDESKVYGRDEEQKAWAIENKALPAFVQFILSTVKTLGYKIDLKGLSPVEMKKGIADTMTVYLVTENGDKQGQLKFADFANGIVTLDEIAIDQSFVQSAIFQPKCTGDSLKIDTDLIKLSDEGITTIKVPFVDQFSSELSCMAFPKDRFQFPELKAQFNYYNIESFGMISNDSPLTSNALHQPDTILTAEKIDKLFSANSITPDIANYLTFQPKMVSASNYYPAVIQELYSTLSEVPNKEKSR